MPTEQQLIVSIRTVAADDAGTLGREIGIAADVLRGVHTQRRRRLIAGTAAAVALVSVATYAGIHAATSNSVPIPTSIARCRSGPTLLARSGPCRSRGQPPAGTSTTGATHGGRRSDQPH